MNQQKYNKMVKEQFNNVLYLSENDEIDHKIKEKLKVIKNMSIGIEKNLREKNIDVEKIFSYVKHHKDSITKGIKKEKSREDNSKILIKNVKKLVERFSKSFHNSFTKSFSSIIFLILFRLAIGGLLFPEYYGIFGEISAFILIIISAIYIVSLSISKEDTKIIKSDVLKKIAEIY